MESFFSGLLTTDYVAGPLLKIADACNIIARATIAGTAPTRVELSVQIRNIGAGPLGWLTMPAANADETIITYVDKPIAVLISGGVLFHVPGGYVGGGALSGGEAQILARRVGGDATTSLVLDGERRYTRDGVSLGGAVSGGGGGGGGSGVLLSASATTQAEGNHSLALGADAFLLKMIQIDTMATDWSLSIYRRDDYATGEHELLSHRSGSIRLALDLPWTDQDSTEELHYSVTDHAGAATHDVAVEALELTVP